MARNRQPKAAVLALIVNAVMLLVVSLTHMLDFEPGQGLVKASGAFTCHHLLLHLHPA